MAKLSKRRNNMEETDKKQCPKCGSLNVSDTGTRIGPVIKHKPNEPIPEPKIPFYQCDNCKKMFIYLGK